MSKGGEVGVEKELVALVTGWPDVFGIRTRRVRYFALARASVEEVTAHVRYWDRTHPVFGPM